MGTLEAVVALVPPVVGMVPRSIQIGVASGGASEGIGPADGGCSIGPTVISLPSAGMVLSDPLSIFSTPLKDSIFMMSGVGISRYSPGSNGSFLP